MSNKQIIYTTPPAPAIDPSLDSGTFRIRTVPRPDHVPVDKVLVRMHYLSVDPGMRALLTRKETDVMPVELGGVVSGYGMAQVIAVGSELSSTYKVGDWVVAFSGWQEYALLEPEKVNKVFTPPGARLTDSLGVLGVTGLTGYFGMLEIGQLKPSDTVVVSGAAGATGMVAGQIARIKGVKRVVGITGSKEKCDFLVRELGFDVAINYKDADWRKQLEEATPEQIDVYFDNTGGEILDVCLAHAAQNSRFIICGAVSQYNAARGKGLTNYVHISLQRITMTGFMVFDYTKKFPTAMQEMAGWLSQGKLKCKEHIVPGGLEAVPQALVDLFAGANTGKMIVEVAPVSTALGDKAQ